MKKNGKKKIFCSSQFKKPNWHQQDFAKIEKSEILYNLYHYYYYSFAFYFFSLSTWPLFLIFLRYTSVIMKTTTKTCSTFKSTTRPSVSAKVGSAIKSGISKATKPTSKSKSSKKSQRLKDQAAQKDLDLLLSTSSIFADLQKQGSKAAREEAKKQRLEQQEERKQKNKSVNQDLLSQLDDISNFSLWTKLFWFLFHSITSRSSQINHI